MSLRNQNETGNEGGSAKKERALKKRAREDDRREKERMALRRQRELDVALREAAGFGNEKEVLALLARGADPKKRSGSGVSALMRAAQSASALCVRALADLSEIDAQDDQGWTALARAAQSASAEACEWLLERGASAKIRIAIGGEYGGMTPLIVAARAGGAQAMRALAPASDVFARDGYGKSALWWAKESGREECVAAVSEALAHIEGAQIAKELKNPASAARKPKSL